MDGMVESGVRQGNLGVIISAVSALVGIILAILITIAVRKGITDVLNLQSALVHEGDLNLKINPKQLKPNDEIGQLFRVAGSVLEDYRKVNSNAQRLESANWLSLVK